MARRAALILFSLAAIAGVAVGQDASAASADPTRYHGGGGHGGGGYKPNGRVSTYNPNTKRYSPVSVRRGRSTALPAGRRTASACFLPTRAESGAPAEPGTCLHAHHASGEIQR